MTVGLSTAAIFGDLVVQHLRFCGVLCIARSVSHPR